MLRVDSPSQRLALVVQLVEAPLQGVVLRCLLAQVVRMLLKEGLTLSTQLVNCGLLLEHSVLLPLQ